MSSSSFFDFHARVTRRRPASAAPPRAPATQPAPAPDVKASEPLTVTQLTRQIDRVLKAGMPATVLVKGELSSYKPHAASGHIYFTLKDAGSCIDCVMWRDDGARLAFEPVTGMELLATGRVAVYLERGKYQLYVTDLRPLGQGALELAFRQLCERLEREGLFAPERKKPLPPYPRRLVLVTSRQTAALQDMLKVLRRYPWLRIAIYHVPVQGAEAGREIAAALRHLDRFRETAFGPDLILLGRGGGSIEDLWCFNDEAVARAIAASRIPVVTGIGHEVDTSIADLVADYHAHTPTEAAQVVVQHWRAARDGVAAAGARLGRAVRQLLQDSRHRLRAIEQHETFRRPLLRVWMYRQLMDDREKALALLMADRIRDLRRAVTETAERVDRHHPSLLVARLRNRLAASGQRLEAATGTRLRAGTETVTTLATRLAERHPRHRVRLASQRLADLDARFRRAMADDLQRRAGRLEALSAHLLAVGPEQVLRRGFTLTVRKKDGRILRSAAEVRPGDRMITRFADGQVEWTAEDPRQPGLFP